MRICQTPANEWKYSPQSLKTFFPFQSNDKHFQISWKKHLSEEKRGFVYWPNSSTIHPKKVENLLFAVNENCLREHTDNCTKSFQVASFLKASAPSQRVTRTTKCAICKILGARESPQTAVSAFVRDGERKRIVCFNKRTSERLSKRPDKLSTMPLPWEVQPTSSPSLSQRMRDWLGDV